MSSLIKNELYKIFHKKGIYIVLIVTVLYTLLTNFIYSTDFVEEVSIDSDYELEVSFVESMEKDKKTDSEEYINSKIYIEKYLYAKTFGDDSWQRYILTKNNTYNNRLDVIISTITKYELNQSINKEDYDNAILEKKILTKKLNEMDWEKFLEEEIIETEKLLHGTEEKYEKYLYQAKMEALTLRQKHNIKYGFNDLNDYLEIYQNNRSIVLSYEDIDEKTLKEETKNIKKEAIKESELAKYKIENNIPSIPYGSNHYILTNFYSEYFMMILVIIVLVSGSIVSEEFSKGTIKLLLIKPYSRFKILLSKYITALIMILFAIIVTFVMQIIIGGLFFGYESLSIPYITYNLTTNTIESISVFKYFFLLNFSLLPKLILISTLAFMLSTITTSTSLANTLTLLVTFGSNIINILVQSFEIEQLKFLVTLNWDWSVYLFGATSPYKGVTLPFSIMISSLYLIAMLIITVLVFKKKNIKNI